MEEAIRLAIEKIGLGVSVSGSDYEFFSLSPEEISQLSEFQVLSRTVPEFFLTIGRSFETLNNQLSRFGPGPFDGQVEEVVSRLQTQVDAAFRNSEEANNALVLIMLAESGMTTPPTVSTETKLAPFQNLLFSAWLIREFSPPVEVEAGSSLIKGLEPILAQQTPEECVIDCRNTFSAAIIIAFNLTFRNCIILALTEHNRLDLLPTLEDIIANPPSNSDALRNSLSNLGIDGDLADDIIDCFEDFIDRVLRVVVEFSTCVQVCEITG